ncbi:MAG: 3-dehydroquinate synthase [Phycisphaerae bacterium]|nr:3-dehydroquinate synthase [Phycisphaerae bacterium]
MKRRIQARVRVAAGTSAYSVVIGDGLIGDLGSLAGDHGAVFVVADRGLPASTVASAVRALARSGRAVTLLSIAATERGKSIATLTRILGRMAAARVERGGLVVGLGGGIVTDVAGFAAAVYQRGVAVVQVPTTLLAMVDASVGGKTGVNLEVGSQLRKNLVGAFHQPRLVIADVGVLESLPEREFACGLAECVKHGMVSCEGAGRGLLPWTESRLDRIMARDRATLVELVRRNVAVKAAVVAGDEREEHDGARARAILNLGHTFAHAMETLPGVRGVSATGRPARAAGLKHGEAVGLGLIAACAAAERLGISPATLRPRAEGLLSRIGLPVRVAGLPGDAVLAARMMGDKKVRGGRLRLVLPRGPGRVGVVAGPPAGVVSAGWASIRAVV